MPSTPENEQLRVKLSVEVTQDVYDVLDELHWQKRVPVAHLVRQALDEFLKRMRAKA